MFKYISANRNTWVCLRIGYVPIFPCLIIFSPSQIHNDHFQGIPLFQTPICCFNHGSLTIQALSHSGAIRQYRSTPESNSNSVHTKRAVMDVHHVHPQNMLHLSCPIGRNKVQGNPREVHTVATCTVVPDPALAFTQCAVQPRLACG